MVLVAYSDSEESDDEKPQKPAERDPPSAATKSETKFTVDKSNPRKIRVNLQAVRDNATENGAHEDEPALKRPRLGGGFSGFNAMLPAPKRDAQTANGVKTASNRAPRKVFGLKTGAEPGFSRESDAELRELFAEQATEAGVDGFAGRKDMEGETEGSGGILKLPPVAPSAPLKQGNPMMFKPLSVARNNQKTKKKPPAKASSLTARPQTEATRAVPTSEAPAPSPAPAPKVNLFSIGETATAADAAVPQRADYETLVYQGTEEDQSLEANAVETAKAPADPSAVTFDHFLDSEAKTQSLASIASDLNLSASARRQLLGRAHKDTSNLSASSVINFNTDREYAANEALRASGEQVQHNPVRAIAPGKHSLKQLVNAASGQKEALEESFASGRRNKKEAGSRYGW
jgi:Mitotic checkpoint regulator, MAD2B-interacting